MQFTLLATYELLEQFSVISFSNLHIKWLVLQEYTILHPSCDFTVFTYEID